MWKVVLVDDEMLVRIGIKMMGDWAGFHMEVVAEGSDGLQALALYDLHKPDLVITDIMMPQMDGIELLAALRKRSSDVRVVLLTNYDDKQYIKEALRLGANDFVAKTDLAPDSLNAILRTQAQELQKQQTAPPAMSGITASQKKQFLIQMVNQAYDSAGLSEKFSHYVLQDNPAPFTCALLNIRTLQSAAQPLSSQYLLNLVQGVLVGNSLILARNERLNTIKVLILGKQGELNRGSVNDLCSLIVNAVGMYTKLQLYIGVSQIITQCSQAKELAQTAQEATLCASVRPATRILFYEDVQSEAQEPIPKMYHEYLRRLYVCTMDGLDDAQKLCAFLIDAMQALQSRTLKRLFCNEFCAWFNRLRSTLKAQSAQALGDAQAQYLLGSFDCRELRHMVDQFIQDLQARKGQKATTGNEAIDQVLAYVNRNFSGQITLGDVAAEVHLSKNYLSGLFSDVMGCSFVDYLTKYRIDKAADILYVTDLRIQEVAELVGFSSERYFSHTFKTLMQKSPTQYRSALRGT